MNANFGEHMIMWDITTQLMFGMKVEAVVTRHYSTGI